MALVSYDATVGDVNKFKTVEYWESRKIFKQLEPSDFLPHEIYTVVTVDTNKGDIKDNPEKIELFWAKMNEISSEIIKENNLVYLLKRKNKLPLKGIRSKFNNSIHNLIYLKETTMRTNESLEIIEKWQKKICFIGQSLIVRSKSEEKFSTKTTEDLPELTKEAIHCLGAIKQEIYRFIQNNKEVKINCQYDIKKPVSLGREDGDIQGVQNKLLKLLSDCKVELKPFGTEILISINDNRRFIPTEIYKDELNKLNEIIDNFSSLISSDENCKPKEPVEKTTITEITTEEKKTSQTTTTSQPEDGQNKTESSEETVHNPAI